MDEDKIEPRYLPLQRFERVELLDDASREPKNFDMEEFIHKNNLGFTYSNDLYTFEAIFDKTMAYHLVETPLNDTQTVEELDEHRLRIKARIPDTLQFEQWLMSFGADVEILKPTKLRNKFKELSKKFKFYILKKMINYLIFGILFLILEFYLSFDKFKNKDAYEKGGNENLENKLNEVSNDINEIEIALASVTTPINELNRFLGGNVTTGRLGEWNLESIVQDIMPDSSYSFQDLINPDSADRVDCAITTAEGFIVPIDSKFYAGQYQNYQSAGNDNERKKF